MPNKTITQVPVTLPRLSRLTVEVTDSVPTAFVTYTVVDNAGVLIGANPAGGAGGANRSASIPLTGPQTTTLVNFLTSVILPAINTQEGT